MLFPLKLWVEKDTEENLIQLIKYANSLFYRESFLTINLKANFHLNETVKHFKIFAVVINLKLISFVAIL